MSSLLGKCMKKAYEWLRLWRIASHLHDLRAPAKFPLARGAREEALTRPPRSARAATERRRMAKSRDGESAFDGRPHAAMIAGFGVRAEAESTTHMVTNVIRLG